MKKKGLLYIWLIPLAFIIYILFAWLNPIGEKLPSFNILLPDSLTLYNTKKVPEGKSVILMFFSPDCDHCQMQVSNMLKNMDSLKNIRLIFITVDPFDNMRKFYDFYKINKYSNIIIGQDIDWYFPNHFNTGQTPYIVLYNKNLRAQKAIVGITSCHKILEYIN